MAEIKYKPIRHDHDAFLKKAHRRQGFQAAYQARAVEYAVANEMLAARARAGLTQEAVAARMGTSKSTISRLESAGKHAPSLTSLKKYAKAVGCKVEIRLVPQREARGSPISRWSGPGPSRSSLRHCRGAMT